MQSTFPIPLGALKTPGPLPALWRAGVFWRFGYGLHRSMRARLGSALLHAGPDHTADHGGYSRRPDPGTGARSAALVLYLAEGADGPAVFSPNGPGALRSFSVPRRLSCSPTRSRRRGRRRRSSRSPRRSQLLPPSWRDLPPASSSSPWAQAGSPTCFISTQTPHGIWAYNHFCPAKSSRSPQLPAPTPRFAKVIAPARTSLRHPGSEVPSIAGKLPILRFHSLNHSAKEQPNHESHQHCRSPPGNQHRA